MTHQDIDLLQELDAERQPHQDRTFWEDWAYSPGVISAATKADRATLERVKLKLHRRGCTLDFLKGWSAAVRIRHAFRGATCGDCIYFHRGECKYNPPVVVGDAQVFDFGVARSQPLGKN